MQGRQSPAVEECVGQADLFEDRMHTTTKRPSLAAAAKATTTASRSLHRLIAIGFVGGGDDDGIEVVAVHPLRVPAKGAEFVVQRLGGGRYRP